MDKERELRPLLSWPPDVQTRIFAFSFIVSYLVALLPMFFCFRFCKLYLRVYASRFCD